MTVVLDDLSENQRQSWLGLLDVASAFPAGWCLVGGQMVQLLCHERGFVPTRPTDDGDVALDVRAYPHVLRDFTQALTELGFEPTSVNADGHQHRWARGAASLDVLIPQGIGPRTAARTGVTGGTTLQSPGAQQAIARSKPVSVLVGTTRGVIRRPNLLGAMVSKAAAFSVPSDPHKERHLTDFAVLATMVSRSDRIAEQLTPRDRRYLVPLLAVLERSRGPWSTIGGSQRGIQALGALVRVGGATGSVTGLSTSSRSARSVPPPGGSREI